MCAVAGYGMACFGRVGNGAKARSGFWKCRVGFGRPWYVEDGFSAVSGQAGCGLVRNGPKGRCGGLRCAVVRFCVERSGEPRRVGVWLVDGLPLIREAVCFLLARKDSLNTSKFRL